MINYLIGKIILKQEGLVVIENNSIGFEVNVSNNTLAELPIIGEDAKIFTCMNVREDDISLFGFASIEEKKLFFHLTSVSGIGPKIALSILSGLKLSDLTFAIVSGDIRMLSTIKGLGKKTAERLVLELKDKISTIGDVTNIQNDVILNNSNIDDATEALSSLGLSKNEAFKLAKTCATEESTVEEIITRALKLMGR